MNKIETASKNDCCGCTACYTVCPVQAIKMTEDEEGFSYPQIEESKCIDCGKCVSVCPLRKNILNRYSKHFYAVKNKDEFVRSRSSSGGVFSLLAEYVENNSGIVYGAAFDDKFKVKHMKAEQADEWKKFCVSKYSQSDMGDTYFGVKRDLCEGKMVLFSGTPCQVDGLCQYLDKEQVSQEKLITCDIVCHGVPSPKIWDEYLTYISKKKKKEIAKVSFRDKSELGWHDSTLTIEDKHENKLVSETKKENYYFQLFFCHYILRPACHSCKYANFHRVGDISLGDFWGIEKNFAEYDDNKGISLVMINSDKGIHVWNRISDKTDWLEVSMEQAIQPNLQAPSEENENRQGFWHWYIRYGLKIAGQRFGYLPKTGIDDIKVFLCRCCEAVLRMIKK